jgi:hypothetical protein
MAACLLICKPGVLMTWEDRMMADHVMFSTPLDVNQAYTLDFLNEIYQ